MEYIRKIYEKKIILSFLLCLIVGLVISIVNEFRFVYYTNDDYQLSLLFLKGETHNLYVSYFLSFILSWLNNLMPAINCFTVFQQLSCFFLL